MNAIDLLEQQHKEVDQLFKKAEKTQQAHEKEFLFAQVADALAMHATIEEKIFYPAVKASDTADILLEAVEEHLEVKRIIADMLDLPATDSTFDAKLKVLQENVDHHVEEERSDLFPKVKKLMNAEQLEALGQEMTALMMNLEGTNARFKVKKELDSAAPI